MRAARLALSLAILAGAAMLAPPVVPAEAEGRDPPVGNAITTPCAKTAAAKRPTKAQHQTVTGRYCSDHLPA